MLVEGQEEFHYFPTAAYIATRMCDPANNNTCAPFLPACKLIPYFKPGCAPRTLAYPAAAGAAGL